ncbi:hypothetical protein B0J13DRAFT_547713 [Dactylonectria estremocensis]|uniref:Uncharacterized protein n=1 Tax=Dactylonectria estremocensis TaxID=1079267 RepID=A0A9P9F3U0_9HYPO|nr:hypothetical protein B0J13DRAFT_547713 [Dactylonectria estremocensis]
MPAHGVAEQILVASMVPSSTLAAILAPWGIRGGINECHDMMAKMEINKMTFSDASEPSCGNRKDWISLSQLMSQVRLGARNVTVNNRPGNSHGAADTRGSR